ncbi:LOW QUALITY PROTEIN: ABC transporter C family member 8-like [Ipomoea triloba]|uniref:LOW QUALITY PROTEIN: ABC transporter C family member 8-like n=1 Tax=Ipomoea triloba TaxID=35885 RepID=UPI00125D204A|nr:LOW QUALITY PROTEIN: ABC transporter C family member 8-like [Ipomoea triloba]
MASTQHSLLGEISWICGGDLDWSSLCIHRALVDALSLLLAFLFFLLLLVGSVMRIDIRGSRRSWITLLISLCCALTSFGYLGASLWELITKNTSSSDLSWLPYFIKGVIWISFTLSLLVLGSKIVKVVMSCWWVVFFLMVSSLNIEVLITTYSIQILDVISWIITFLLPFCAIRNLHLILSQPAPEKSLSEPLLLEQSDESQTLISHASFFSQLSFSWMNHLLRLGKSKTLLLEDIPCLGMEDEAKLNYEKLSREWDILQTDNRCNGSANLILRAIARLYWKEMVLGGFYLLLRSAAVVVAPLLLYAFVAYSNLESTELSKGFFLVGCLIVDKVIDSLSNRHFFFYTKRIGMRIRSGLMVAVYQKQLKLSNQGRQRHSTGEVVNYIAIDAYRMGESAMWFHVGWISGLQILLSICVLFWVVGFGALLGLVPLAICGLLNVPFAKVLQKCQFEFMIAQDKRLRCMSEILNSMKIIKLQSWEENFKHIIESYREIEFKWLSKTQYCKTLNTFLYWMSPTIISSVIFLGCVLLNSAAFDSSLLYAILGEVPKVSGTVNVFGSNAYVSQASWIQSGTIRDNILFGKSMDKNRYDEAIRVSALDKDINSFDYGDLTEIGQRGLNMSGGQKQRIQLARAVYSDADVYLLDDPFSAVDAHTASTLFNDCVMSALAMKTVILVTHQVEFLSAVDHILVMEGGEITQSGSYNELLMTGMAFEQLLNAHKKAVNSFDPVMINNDRIPDKEYSSGLEEVSKSFVNEENSQISLKGGTQLTEDEEMETTDAMWKIFMDYVSVSKGTFYLILNFVTQTGFVVLQAAASYWLALSIQSPKFSHLMIIGVYTLVSLLSAFFVYLRSLFSALLGLKASKAFFSGFINSVFKAPMLFFDSTPVGRILTRASSDQSVLDFDIPFAYTFVMAAGIELVATIVIMASVTWQVLIVGIIATIGSKYVQEYYQPSARELMRINGTTKAPIMSYATETSLGVATIRAFDMVDRFFQNYLKLVDADAKVFLSSNGAMEWLVLRTEVLQNLTLFVAAFLLILVPTGYLPSGLVGLSLSYAFALTGTQVFLSRWYSSLANYVISAERIKQYMHLTPEPPAVVEDNRPNSSWPSKGRIELVDLKIRYRSNAPLVLKGITCTFSEGTRVGVVGRTGSGKTTLISALFRLVEPYSGQIIIDGIDVCSIGLKDLRLKLSIIPQEPALFRGSVRTNLDPLGLYSDDEIWKALEKCQLKDIISKLPLQLDSSVSDDGENWSMGQRQLFCLGRVLLKRNRILVLDEATASIDSATDATLQKIIREEFCNCTVITVAHRVPTVIDSDMVLVLSFGKLVEYDEPSKLMEETNSAFSKLVAEYWSSCTRNSLPEFNH